MIAAVVEPVGLKAYCSYVTFDVTLTSNVFVLPSKYSEWHRCQSDTISVVTASRLLTTSILAKAEAVNIFG